jgi:FlaG/FlaF family flagellin (archaellin)
MRMLKLAARADGAVTSIVGFVAAVAIYGVAFAAFLAFTQAPAFSTNSAPELGARSQGSVEQLVNSAGQGVNAKAWVLDPDNITRFGIAVDGMPGQLDTAKLRNLTRGGMVANGSNGLLDYAEAQAALGLGPYDFHLRTYPLLVKLADAGLHPVKGLRVAYVGDWSMVLSNGSSSYLVDYASSVKDMGSYVLVNVSIHNNGTTDAVFQTAFSVPLADGTITDTANTGLLLAGTGQENVTLKLYKTSGWAWAGGSHVVTVNIKDTVKSVANFQVDLGGIDMGAGSSPYAMAVVSPEKLVYKTIQFPKIDFDLFDGKGDQVVGVNIRSNFSYAGNNSLIAYDQESTKRGSSNKWDAPKGAEGEYNMTVNTTGDYAFNSFDRVYVTDGDGGVFTPAPTYTYQESPASIAERAMLADLVDNFANTTYNNSAGDVYMDFSSVMNDDLADNLSSNGSLLNYSVLVVGSNVDQNAMTSGAATSAVRNFTVAGGLLIVLGSQAQTVGWLQQLFQSSLTTATGGLGVPDPTNPILHVPEELAYRTYPDNGVTWALANADSQHFTNVVTRSTVAPVQDTLAVSKPGNFGNGTIVLTGWELWNLTAPQDKLEAERVLYNFLNQAYGTLFVDFGPSIPSYAEVASSSRLATAPHPWLQGQDVAVRVTMYVFK